MMRLLLLLAVCAAAATARKSYDGYRLYEITPRTAEQVELLKNVRETFADSVMFEDDIPSAGYSMDVLASPNAKDIIRNLMRQADIQYTIRRENIQDFIDAERERMSHKQAYDPNDYNTYADIQAELQRLSTVCPAGFSCQIRTLGLSTLGNEINAIAISESGQSDKEVVWIDSLIHAREWIAGTSIMRTAAELIEGYGSNPEATELLDGYDFVILPVFNPDGYIHAWEEDRFWRKSRNVNEGSNCIGTDLNRNHQYAWGEQPGASTNPCSDTYMGSGPASEPEVSTVELAIQSLAASRSVAIVMSVHTAAEAWLMPYGNEVDNVCAIPADYDDMLQVGQAAVDAVVEAGGDEWRLGGACETLYAATGITCDFAYAIAGVKYSYTPELKGPSFDPEPDQIEPAFQEFFAAVVASVREREIIEFGASRK